MAQSEVINTKSRISPLERSKRRLHTIIVFIIIVGSVYIDLLNGYFNDYKSIPLPVGIVFRTAVILFTFVFIVGYKRLYLFKAYIFLIMLVWVICNIYWVSRGENINILMETSYFVKLLYPMFIAYYFKYIIDKRYITFDLLLKYTVINGVTAGLFIIFSFITGIGLVTYGNGETGVSYGFGTTSFFKAQNDLSLAMLIAFGVSLYYLFRYRKGMNLLKAVIIFIGLILIGTRAGLLGGVAIVFVFIIYETIYGGGSNQINIFRKLSTLLIAIAVTIGGCVFIYIKIKNNPYMLKKYAASELQSPRAILEKSADVYLEKKENTLFTFLFGRGNNTYEVSIPINLTITGNASESVERLAEEDLIDLVGGYGVVLAYLVYVLPVIALIKLVVEFLKNKKDYLKFSLAFVLFLFITHSILAGHGMRSPEVGTILPVIYVYYFNITDKSQKQLALK